MSFSKCEHSLHTLPLHVGDLMKQTAHLSHDQFGAYMRLVLVHFGFGAAGIPQAQLHRYARVSAAVWQRRYEEALLPLFVQAGGHVHLPWLCDVLDQIVTRSGKQRAKALKRWESENAAAVPTEKPESGIPKTKKPESESPESRNQESEKPESQNQKAVLPVRNDTALKTHLYEQFPGVTTAEEFVAHLPKGWRTIAASYGVEPEFIDAVAAGFWERFVGRFPNDPLLQERFPAKANWEKAWQYECDRLDRVKRKLPPRKDLPMQAAKEPFSFSFFKSSGR